MENRLELRKNKIEQKRINMEKEEGLVKARRWAELYTAIAEGKYIQKEYGCGEWRDVDMSIDGYGSLEGFPEDYRIKPQPKTRRKTNVELSDWLRNCPEEHREYKFKESSLSSDPSSVWFEYSYESGKENEPCDDVLIRRNHGEWEEPLVEIND